ncbi:membrane protein [Pseudobacteroides cellulosolvens]|uniref:EamA domain-containing protein n=1 Tax=Pseudobacteroides cellulosolvens ATCC 35603 = DSM 2933 TaxID=398512 RepID=A0A0L6JUW7_9FIRM|nr:membrane protein [Pseudobacteroides cellulosolvens]KNY29197.1 protein of unknown function DUF6 transmembrane [Pseudobacteroides cellulosolvens ATCC 35603 = DSM 2933]
MLFYFIAIALTIVSNTFYHIFQKSIPNNVNPFVSLIATYITAIVVCLIILPFYPSEISLVNSIRKLNWTSFVLGFAVIGLELGFLLAYRAGWNISLGALFSNVAVTILLVPIGISFFKESLSSINVIGMVLCIGGILLLSYKR